METTLCTATSNLHPTVWVLIYLIPVIVGLLLLRYMWLTRNPTTYMWKVVDEAGNHDRVVAATPEEAIAKLGARTFGLRAVKLRNHLGQYIEE